MAATAADYAWFEGRFPDLAEAYCLTLVGGLSPPQVLARLGARTNGPHVTGVDRLPVLDLGTDDEQLIGVTAVEHVPPSPVLDPAGEPRTWALAVEPGGRLGVTDDAIVTLSAGTRLVSHARGTDGRGLLCWLEDGEIRATAARRAGSPAQVEGDDADTLLEILRSAGAGVEGDSGELPVAAAFALAEHLTGVRLTAELLTESSYLCGLAPYP